jgi:threonine efflux protein
MIFENLAPYLQNLFLILSVFIIGAASPGPATLMILNTGVTSGRRASVALSLGIVTGSAFWGAVAGLGLVAILQTSALFFSVFKIVGALYLFYLAYNAWRSALRGDHKVTPNDDSESNALAFFTKGLLLHLTNPKAPLVWLATLAVGVGDGVPAWFLIAAILICCLSSMAIFIGYALLFSTQRAARAYASVRRPVDAVLGLVFGAAAVKILSLKGAGTT